MIAHTIQLALAPVFVLVAIGNILNILSTRLGRIVDRARVLQQRHGETADGEHDRVVRELRKVDRRISLIGKAIAMLVVSGLAIGTTVAIFMEFIMRWLKARLVDLGGKKADLAINATLQIDLLGQCGSESLGHIPYSGTGGQSDFVRAANRSKGGKAFIVLPSTAKNDTISRIVPTLSPGTHVSTSKNDINYVVTEFGVAQLRGKSVKQRAAELISIAHPDFRAELTDQAKRMGLF